MENYVNKSTELTAKPASEFDKLVFKNMHLSLYGTQLQDTRKRKKNRICN